MSFASAPFFALFATVLIFLALTNTKLFAGMDVKALRRIRHIILLVSSYVFYGWWDWRFCFLMLFMSAAAFASALMISKQRHVKLFKILGIACPLIILGFFKYFNFFISTFSTVFGITNVGALNIILPMGISFYTFHVLSYTIDVMRGKVKPTESFVDMALYIAFFPQLVAGPIVKASFFLPQLSEDRNVSTDNIAKGIQIFLFGLFKKIVIADYLSVFVDNVFSVPKAYSALTVILAIISYSIQIYFDFSGYSDMAIGCAKCLGYDLPRNFNLPYLSQNVSEFWKRWHISLSSWLKEYLYISLGGNRKGKIRTYINLMATMVLGGLWHGANWTFVFWGFLHGAALCVHKLFLSLKKKKSALSAAIKVVNVITTYVFVCIAWVFFRAGSFENAVLIISRLFVWNTGITQIYTWTILSVMLLAGATSVAIVKSHKSGTGEETGIAEGFYPIFDLNKFWPLVLVIFFAGLTFGLAYTGLSPFIYFQF